MKKKKKKTNLNLFSLEISFFSKNYTTSISDFFHLFPQLFFLNKCQLIHFSPIVDKFSLGVPLCLELHSLSFFLSMFVYLPFLFRCYSHWSLYHLIWLQIFWHVRELFIPKCGKESASKASGHNLVLSFALLERASNLLSNLLNFRDIFGANLRKLTGLFSCF